MPSKLVDPRTKAKAIERLLAGESAADIARRYNVNAQTVRWWFREWRKKNPDAYIAWQAAKAAPPAPPAPAPAAGAHEAAAPAGAGADHADEVEDDADAEGGHAEALKGAGLPAVPPPGPDVAEGGAPPAAPVVPAPQPGAPQFDEISDEDLVRGMSSMAFGWVMRIAKVVAQLRYGVKVQLSGEGIDALYTMTEREWNQVKPCSGWIARKLREVMGTNERVAQVTGGGLLIGMIQDRYTVVDSVVAGAAAHLKEKPDGGGGAASA